MDLLINLADTREKFDIDISSSIQNILDTAININKLLENTQEMVINYTNDDLICMNDITIERIDNIANLFINEFEEFCMNLMMIDENTIDLYVMNELRDIFINQELSILRLDSLLSKDINIYIKNMKNDINREANNILQKYNVIERINNYIQKSKDTILDKYLNEIVDNMFPSNCIDIRPTDYNLTDNNIEDLLEFIKKKYENHFLPLLNSKVAIYFFFTSFFFDILSFFYQDNTKALFLFFTIFVFILDNVVTNKINASRKLDFFII